MTKKLILIPLLILSFLFAGCHSYSHYRPAQSTPDVLADTQDCIAACQANKAGDEDYYYNCLRNECGMVQERGTCKAEVALCEERSQISPLKTAAVIATTTLTVIVVGGTLLFFAAIENFDCGEGHC